jgi:hypothetical protein|tara:strand:+ start:169 stop:471 length:303 start_codon:yes stop_codon:yes gene_type:complete
MRAYEPPKNKDMTPPFAEGDRVDHVSLGGGFVKGVKMTGGGNWSIFVEFDEYQERIKGRFAAIIPSHEGKVYLKKADDPYEDVEFGTNILDLDTAIQDTA